MLNKSSVLRPALCAVLLAAGAATAQTPTPAPAAAAPAPPLAPETVQVRPITANVTVTDQQLLNANSDQDNWLLYGRTYDNQRFSPLTQINSGNVKRLAPVAIIQTGIANSFEVTPIVVNGVMYVVTPTDHVMAYNAVTGDPLWVYNPVLGYTRLCCGPQARGVAVAYGKVFVGRVDGVMVALDARTGKVVWQSDPATSLPDQPTLFSFTAAPQVYDGMVVIGSAGAEYPIRGFVQAYEVAQTGKGGLAFPHHGGAGRAGRQQLERRFLEDRRRFGLEQPCLRSRPGHDQLRRGQSQSRHKGRDPRGQQ